MQAGKTIKLSVLAADLVTIKPSQDCLITGITLDSRMVKNGDLFLACVGASVDGRDFIIEALQKGAAAVFCENSVPTEVLPQIASHIPIIAIANLPWQISLLAARFYDYPATKLTLIGVTGTNGKTSITQYLATILTRIGTPCGVIGTMGSGFPGNLDATLNTTPDALSLQRLLFELRSAGAKAVAMEVSSQGLAQGRVSGVAFNFAVFTNLTRDHLDYHGTMANYGAAKKNLFCQHPVQYAVINMDDEFGRNLIKELNSLQPVYAYTTGAESLTDGALIKAHQVKLKATALLATETTPWGAGVLKSKLLGRFNLSNLLAVLTVLGIMGVNLEMALVEIAKLEAAEGRMQVVGGDRKRPLVVIDYAHTPDALEKALLTLRDYCRGALWCVFGCGGERDRGKRPLMGKIAERYSDHVVITNDNPRAEDQQQIVDDILQGLLCPWAVEVEYDRMAAIEYVINHATENDVILLAGKGHEEYQLLGQEKIAFSDKLVALKALDAKIV